MESYFAQKYNLKKQSLADQIYHHIKKLILSGEIKGGNKIPEEKIANIFGVSRTPVREALKKLELYGLVHTEPRSYAIVVELDQNEAQEISRIRYQIETLTVGQLVRVGSEEDFDYLTILSQECEQNLEIKDIASVFEKDSELHLEIARRTGHKHLYEIYEKIDAKIQLLRTVVHLPINKLAYFIHQHEELIRAMKEKNGKKAQQLIKQHIIGQLDFLSINEIK